MKKLYFMTYFNKVYPYESAIQWGRLKARKGNTIYIKNQRDAAWQYV
jgi:hypothetical protein